MKQSTSPKKYEIDLVIDPTQKPIHVAVGIVFNTQNQVLMAKRPDHAHQGGLWEFPGGKLEPNESTQDALTRELYEEVGIKVIAAQPLTTCIYDYQTKVVLLDVWHVTEFHGEPHSCEGQLVRWVPLHELAKLDVPLANHQIVATVLDQFKSN